MLLPTEADEIIALLSRFNEKVEKLQNFSFQKQACAPGNGFSIEFGVGKPLIARKIGADDESTYAAIVRLRLLVGERDRISF